VRACGRTQFMRRCFGWSRARWLRYSPRLLARNLRCRACCATLRQRHRRQDARGPPGGALRLPSVAALAGARDHPRAVLQPPRCARPQLLAPLWLLLRPGRERGVRLLPARWHGSPGREGRAGTAPQDEMRQRTLIRERGQTSQSMGVRLPPSPRRSAKNNQQWAGDCSWAFQTQGRA
jgi:hypothetical protein